MQRLRAFLADPRLTAWTQPGRMFLALAIPFGIVFLFLSAPFQAPDEHHHFYRAYAISSGHLTGMEVTLPQSVFDFSTTVSKDLPGNDQNKQSKQALVQEFSRPFEEQPQVKVNIINSAIVSPLPYLPQALGIFIGRTARLNPIFIFYLGRVANLLIWLGLTYLAIRVTPIHPRLFAALALMPMTLHQAASNSPDAVTIAVSFLFVAFALRILLEPHKDMRWSDWAWVGVLAVALALCKSLYVLSAGLLLLVPLRRYRFQRAVLPLALAVIGLGVVAGLVWLKLSAQTVSVEMMNTYRTPTLAGVTYVLLHPQVSGLILWHSAVTYFPEQARMFIGVLGWFDTVLPDWVYPVYYALLLFLALFEPLGGVYLLLRERIFMAGMAVLASALMLAIFFYPGITEGNGIVDIVQGRYYIPFGLLYLLPFSLGKSRRLPQTSPAWAVVALLHVLVLLVAVRAMLWRYYAI